MFAKYKVVEGVPIYVRTPFLVSSREELRILRRRYPCFISENSRGKYSSSTIIWTMEDSSDYDVSVKNIVVMARARAGSARRAVELLRSRGYKANPYTSPRCLGFYAHSYDEIEEVLRIIRGYVEAVAVVNTVWYIYYRELVNLRKLIDSLFTPPVAKNFKFVVGSFNYSTVRIFYNGTVGVHGVHTPASIKVFARKLHSFLRSIGAVR